MRGFPRMRPNKPECDCSRNNRHPNGPHLYSLGIRQMSAKDGEMAVQERLLSEPESSVSKVTRPRRMKWRIQIFNLAKERRAELSPRRGQIRSDSRRLARGLSALSYRRLG